MATVPPPVADFSFGIYGPVLKLSKR
jgi:hypothetical protein